MDNVFSPVTDGKPQSLAQAWGMARWNLSRAMLITRREIRDMLRDWRILAPIFVLTVIFPFIANWGAGRMVNYVNQFGAELIGERLIPFLLLVVGFFPISFSLIIALESFAGEKERRSLEPLLNSPLTDLQLYIGKMTASTVAPLVGAVLGITVYLVGVYFNVDYRPPAILLIQILLLTALQAVVMVAGAVVVSSQSTSVRAANLLASFIIIPVAFLIQLEAFIMFLAAYDVLWWIMLGLLVIAVVLINMGVKTFNRETLLGSDLDELDLFATFRSWYEQTLARQNGQRGPLRWYRDEILAQIPRLMWPILILVLASIAAGIIGVSYAEQFPIPEGIANVEDWAERFPSLLGEAGFAGVGGVFRVIGQNLRVLVLGAAVGVFTLGVVMVLLVMAPFTIIGFAFAQVNALGVDANLLYAALIPHSILEIPAILLAGASALRLGASVIAPPPDMTLGEGWMQALADMTRMWVCLVLPLLLLAAIVEVFITPEIVLMVAGG